VTVLTASATRGRLRAGPVTMMCALGRLGLRHRKREGDGATPIGAFRLMQGFWRADRGPRLLYGQSPLRAIDAALGWCDDPKNPNYNRLVRLPFRGGCEALWRTDRLYDAILVLDYNIAPSEKGAGSAIFLHAARDGFGATEGCIALTVGDLRRLLPRLSKTARISIGARR
jgi:L,D-peptidoglycan transpeptidase YkuD (ErfK/YbiS/YcfS/YnhG family)